MSVGDMVFVKDSQWISTTTPLILVEKYHGGNSLYFVVLNPTTGERYEYQEHNLTKDPV